MIAARSASPRLASPPNKPMHPTANTRVVINPYLAERRVKGGVRRFFTQGSAPLLRLQGVDIHLGW